MLHASASLERSKEVQEQWKIKQIYKGDRSCGTKILYRSEVNFADHKYYDLLECDWFKNNLVFSTNSLAKLLSDSLLLDSLSSFSSISQSHSKTQFKSITFKDVVYINQSISLFNFRATLNNLRLLCQSFSSNFPLHNFSILLFSEIAIL